MTAVAVVVVSAVMVAVITLPMVVVGVVILNMRERFHIQVG